MKEHRERFCSSNGTTKRAILLVTAVVSIIFLSVSLLLPEDFKETENEFNYSNVISNSKHWTELLLYYCAR